MAYKRKRIGGSRRVVKRFKGLPVFTTALNLAAGAARNYLRTRTRRRGTDNVTTGQFDYKTQYVKKRMPYRKKRQWVKAVKINRALDIKNLGLKSVVFNSTIQRIATGSVPQDGLNFALYGVKGDTDAVGQRAGFRDLYRIFKNEPEISKTSGGEPKGGKINFASAVLDVTLRNTGQVDVEVDVYYGYHYRQPSSTYGDLFAGYFDPSAPVINAGNQSLTINTRGVTPFDLTEQTAVQRFTIKKKQKFYLPVGKSVFIQHRDPKNRLINWESLEDFPETTAEQSVYAHPWMTYSCLVIFKKVVGTGESDAYQISAGVTRKYSYSVLAQNQDAQASNPLP